MNDEWPNFTRIGREAGLYPAYAALCGLAEVMALAMQMEERKAREIALAVWQGYGPNRPQMHLEQDWHGRYHLVSGRGTPGLEQRCEEAASGAAARVVWQGPGEPEQAVIRAGTPPREEGRWAHLSGIRFLMASQRGRVFGQLPGRAEVHGCRFLPRDHRHVAKD